VYHFYYGDETGSSGTILTFFLIRDWSRAGMGREIYNNMGHTINQDEIDNANKLIFNANV